MVNQDPQPELYTTRAVFTGANTTGDVATSTIFTNQANNEEVRIYAIMVDILNENGAPVTTATTDTDFAITIQVGPNNFKWSDKSNMERKTKLFYSNAKKADTNILN